MEDALLRRISHYKSGIFSRLIFMSLPEHTHLGSSQPELSPDSIQLYEEQLITQKKKIKTGEVKISRHTVIENVEASTSLKKEKIIIEIESVYCGDTRLDVGEAKVAEDGSLSMDIYEERAVVCRQVVPYQNVSIRKETLTDTVSTRETIRREEIAVETEGKAAIEWIDSTET
ncbi:MAG: YsnF/AvaK domain-containing protein [Phormidesmis sp. RL_2_1]|nr:YsnF/AvaK domain-containing protein [Phormidesmis sp. RL_2_1]